jgi:hypothetical protein
MKNSNSPIFRASRDPDLDALLHPAGAFAHPSAVVNDPDLTLNEKRAILASWASDACAVDATPALRRAPGGPPVAVDDILQALRMLDREAQARVDDPSRYRRALRRRSIDALRSGGGAGGPAH